MSKFVLNLILLFIFTFVTELKACECSMTTYRFIDGLKNYDFVGMVEVIGVDTAADKDYEEHFTIVKIINLYWGDYPSDTILVSDGDGSKCYVKIPNNDIGKRFILKGTLDHKKEYEGFRSDLKIPRAESMDNPKVLVLSLCDQNTMVVNNDFVTGHFTTYKIIKKVSEDKYGRIEKYWYEDIYQMYALKKFERKLSRILK